MTKTCSVLTSILLTIAVAVQSSTAVAGNAANAAEIVKGIWNYTNLITSDGKEMPLTGIFLFSDGVFLQQSIFNGEPFSEQGAMAHAGPYTSRERTLYLVAEQTISIDPTAASPLSYRSNTKHEVTVDPNGNKLTLVFGSGTVQELERIGTVEGKVHSLEDGRLAFVDDYFILVQGNEDGSVSGYGTFEKGDGDTLHLNVIRWAEGTAERALNRRDMTLKAKFDGHRLTLPDGRSFKVVR